MWARAQALLVHKEADLAFDAIRSIYVQFDPGIDEMMEEMLDQNPSILVRGASARETIEILENDTTKTHKLAPLVCALRMVEGISVRASTEVLEVADDILAKIEQKRKTQDL